MKDREFKDELYGQLARIGHALASPKRLELLDLLAQRPRTVERLAEQLNQSVATTSHHLRVLRGARLVEAEKQGQFVEYRLAGVAVAKLFVALQQLGSDRLAEIGQVMRLFLESRKVLEPVDRKALLRRVREGAVTVLDVRPVEEYAAGHIPGAHSIPVGELRRRLSEIPKDREIVAYCRGPYCVMAIEAVRILRGKGYSAVRLDEGVAEWRSRGLRVELGVAP
jgi:rhodanese-related sulfurtransferase